MWPFSTIKNLRLELAQAERANELLRVELTRLRRRNADLQLELNRATLDLQGTYIHAGPNRVGETRQAGAKGGDL